MIYKCCDEKRKAAVLGNPTLNGIDYLEVVPARRVGDVPLLVAFCIRAAAGQPRGSALGGRNVRISGGVRFKNIGVQ